LGQGGQCHLLDAQTFGAEFFRRRLAQVDHPSGVKRPAVVDAHFYGSPRQQAAHAHPCTEGQGAVCGGEGAHVKQLTTGGAAAMKTCAVPRSTAALGFAQFVGVAGQGWGVLVLILVGG